MKNTEDIHKLTEAVYKNLVENFNSGVRQLILTGKTYHKALLGVTAAAHAYNDALAKIGSMAKMCRGGTDEIGAAILQIAEAQKSVQAHLEESTKCLFSELILPMEQKLEKEFKRTSSDAKKYSQGHKVVLGPYSKAFDSLKKFRKKTKNKYVYDNEKEAQHMRTLSKCQEKLDEYRVQGLRIAMLEERKCHCFLLQRLCAVSGVNSNGHRRGADLYIPLTQWRDLCANPQVLPQQAEYFIMQHLDDDDDGHANGGPGYHSNGFLHRDTRDTRDRRETQSLGDGIRRSKSTQDIYRRSGHFDGTKTLPPRTQGIPPPPLISPQVQATYSFSSNVDSQLSFIEGDIITIMGEKSEGWQYGENTRSQMMGWFPLSFTQPVASNRGRESPEFGLIEQHRDRGKSVGDLLDSRSLSEHHHFMYEQDVPGNIRRPKSLYDGPSTSQHIQTSQAVRPTHPFTTMYDSVPIYSHQVPIFNAFSDPDQIYQAIPVPPDNLQQHTIYTRRDQSPPVTSATYSSYGQPIKTTEKGFTPIHPSRNSPPLPPPPPPESSPPPIPPSSAYTGQPNTAGVRRMNTGNHVTPSAPSLPAPNPPFPLPPSSIPPMPPSSSSSMHEKPSSSTNPPSFTTPSSVPSKPSVTSMTLLSHQSPQHVSSANGMGYGSPARQPAKPPAPPPPPPQAPWNQPDEDYGIENNSEFKTNPMFSSVSLRRTRTNDRSAPKLN